jgi:hypothetical protein
MSPPNEGSWKLLDPAYNRIDPGCQQDHVRMYDCSSRPWGDIVVFLAYPLACHCQMN